MSLFTKKNDEKCCCGGECADGRTDFSGTQTAAARVKVLGGGCAKCKSLAQAARAALQELGRAPDVDYITDYAAIAAYGVLSTPALVVDGKVVSCGRVLSAAEIVELLQKNDF